MAIKAKVQKDYLLTEASITLPADVSQVDEILRAAGTTGKLVVLYNQGCIGGINVEQRTKIPEGKTGAIRGSLGIDDKVI